MKLKKFTSSFVLVVLMSSLGLQGTAASWKKDLCKDGCYKLQNNWQREICLRGCDAIK